MSDSTFTSGAEKGTDDSSFTGSADKAASADLKRERSGSIRAYCRMVGFVRAPCGLAPGCGCETVFPTTAMWLPIIDAPIRIIEQAKRFPPEIGEDIWKLFCDADGRMWAVEYHNPGGGPIYAMRLPRRGATATLQVGTTAKTNLADEAQQKECP